MNTKRIWATTDTGMKWHAFEGDSARCRSNIHPRMYAVMHDDFRTLDLLQELFTDSDICLKCLAAVRMEQQAARSLMNQAHAEALEMNAERDSQSAATAVITDAELDRRIAGGSIGYLKAARDLRPLSPEDRFTVVQEANCRMALSPGWNFSGAVSQAVRDLGATPMTDQADQLKAYDPEGTKAAEAAARGTSWDEFKEAATTTDAPACTCAAVYLGHHFHTDPCPLNTDTKENSMTLKDGPLTPRQTQILELASSGLRQQQIANMLETSYPVVKMEVNAIVHKFKAGTSGQAYALHARAEAYLAAAELLEDHRSTEPDNETDQHVDHVLNGLALILRERAAALLPR